MGNHAAVSALPLVSGSDRCCSSTLACHTTLVLLLSRTAQDHEPQGFNAVQQQVSRSCVSHVKWADHLFHCFCAVDSSRVCATSHHWQDTVWPLSQSWSRPAASPPHLPPSWSTSFLCVRLWEARRSIPERDQFLLQCAVRLLLLCPRFGLVQFLVCQSSTQDDRTDSTSMRMTSARPAAISEHGLYRKILSGDHRPATDCEPARHTDRPGSRATALEACHVTLQLLQRDVAASFSHSPIHNRQIHAFSERNSSKSMMATMATLSNSFISVSVYRCSCLRFCARNPCRLLLF